MSALDWNRYLYTSVQHGKNWIIVVGFPPFLRAEFGLQPSLMPPLAETDFASAIDCIMPPPREVIEIPGCRSFGMRYGADHAFRVAVLGSPSPTSVVLTKLPQGTPVESDDHRRWGGGWRATTTATWSKILQSCAQWNGDVLLAPGCPPLFRSSWGVHAFPTSPLTDSEVASMVADIVPQTRHATDAGGYLDFYVRYTNTDVFRAAVFGDPLPKFVILMRMPGTTMPDGG